MGPTPQRAGTGRTGVAPVDTISYAPVGVVGAGPEGLLLAYLLKREGIDSFVIDSRTHDEIARTGREGVFDRGTVDLLAKTGASARIGQRAREKEAVDLRFARRGHPISCRGLAKRSLWLYTEGDLHADIADSLHQAGGQVHTGVKGLEVLDVDSATPRIRFSGRAGHRHELRARYLVSTVTTNPTPEVLPSPARASRHHPALLGIATEAAPFRPEMVYAASDEGFAMVSQRWGREQRMWLQCAPEDSIHDWPDDRIWEELQRRLAGPDGFRLQETPIKEKMVHPLDHHVAERLQRGSLLLAGDAAHGSFLPGVGGLRLALRDVESLTEVMLRVLGGGREREGESVLSDYGGLALPIIWQAQSLSVWMVRLLFRLGGYTSADHRSQVAELEGLVASRAGRTFLAERILGSRRKARE